MGIRRLIPLVAIVVLPACSGAGADDTATLQSSLEQENGGLALSSEAPAFGEPALFAEIESENPAPADLDAGDAELMQLSGAAGDRCGFALALGRWHDLSDHLGVFRGRVLTHAGLFGHIKGVFGVRRDGAHVFFGKIIDRNGAAVALVVGHFGDGRFIGRILARDGDHGVIAGRSESAPNDPEHGRFQAILHETRCDSRVIGSASAQ